MRLDTLSARILGALAAILVLLLLAAALFGEIKIRAFHKSEIESRLRTAAELLARQGTDLLAGRADAETVGSQLVDLGKATNLRLTVVRADGTVLADSGAALPLGNHGDRPEIQMASRDGIGIATRHSATTDEDTYYLARRLDEGDVTLGYLRAAAELAVMDRAIVALRKSLALGGLVALLAGLCLSYGLARWISTPLEEMGEGALTVTSGNLDARIPSHGPHEVRLLAGALNSMADKLRQRIRSEQRARSEIETILASMAEGVVAVDSRERVLLMNATAARMLGLVEPIELGSALWQHVRFPELERGPRRGAPERPALARMRRRRATPRTAAASSRCRSPRSRARSQARSRCSPTSPRCGGSSRSGSTSSRTSATSCGRPSPRSWARSRRSAISSRTRRRAADSSRSPRGTRCACGDRRRPARPLLDRSAAASR